MVETVYDDRYLLCVWQELKSLRPQLYQAADYCEHQYLFGDNKQGWAFFHFTLFFHSDSHVHSWIIVVKFFEIIISPTSSKAQLMLELWQGVGQSKGLLSQGIGECCGPSGDSCIQVKWFDCTASTRGGHCTNQYISSCTGDTPCKTSMQLPVKSDFHLSVALLNCKTILNVLNCVKQ